MDREQDHIDKNTFLQTFVFHSKNKAVIIDEKKKKNLTDCEIKLNLIQNRNFLFHFSIVDNQIHRRSSDQIVSGDG